MWRVIPILLSALLLSCAGEETAELTSQILPQESGAPPRSQGSWDLVDGMMLSLEDGRLSMIDGPRDWALADRVIGLPTVSEAGDQIAYCRQGDGIELASIEVWDLAGGARRGPRVLADGDRPALSPDGEWVAFVSGRTGIASLWAVPFEGGAAAQLTNRGLASPAVHGRAPVGFVPPPHEGPPRFENDQLVWDSPVGVHAVELP